MLVNWSGWTDHKLFDDMANKHNTFPGEQPEMPQPEKQPEITQPSDPKIPETPIENPESIPDELPHENNPPEGPPLKGDSL